MSKIVKNNKKDISIHNIIMNYNDNYIFIKTWRETKYPRTKEESFYYFIKNSRMVLISDTSAFGMIYKCHFLKRENKSPYFYIDSMGIYNNVLDIVIKMVLVAKENIMYLDGQSINIEWKYIKDGRLTTYCYDKMDKFIDETKIQQTIAKKGINVLHRNTPIVVYSDLMSRNSKKYKNITQLMVKSAKDGEPLRLMFSEFDKISRIKEREEPLFLFNDFYLGIIGMELIEAPYILCNTIVKPIVLDEILKKDNSINKYDSRTLACKSERLRWIYNIRRYELLRLAIDTGYSQGDYHTENIMIDENNKSAVVLDFGTAKPILNHIQIVGLWNHLKNDNFMKEEENLTIMSKILEEIYIVHFYDVTKEFTEYKWIKEIDQEDCNQIVSLHQEHNQKIRNNSDIFQFYFQESNYQ
jgi:serine/threonine protein kinase